MIFFNKKVKYTILNGHWEVLFDNIIFKIPPRENELIFDGVNYFKVLQLVHKLDSRENVTIIVDIFGVKTED